MAISGTIKTLAIVEGQIVATVATGSGPEVTVVIMPDAGGEFHPLPGDVVVYERSGQEYVAKAVFAADTSTLPGESLIFARNAAGEVVAKIHLKADGRVYVGDGTDFVAMAAKVNAMFELINDIITTWTPVANDGGAALQTAWTTRWPLEKQDVDSTNLKAD